MSHRNIIRVIVAALLLAALVAAKPGFLHTSAPNGLHAFAITDSDGRTAVAFVVRLWK